MAATDIWSTSWKLGMHGIMGIYDLHRLLFDIRSNPELQAAYQHDRESVFQRYRLSDGELTALRTDNFYWLSRLGVGTFLLGPYAVLLGHSLADLTDLLRAGAEAERRQSS
jgi:hypothetical protein